jgi:hypothetical protein
MLINELTKEARTFLEYQPNNHVKSALQLIDAQAAVINQVREMAIHADKEYIPLDAEEVLQVLDCTPEPNCAQPSEHHESRDCANEALQETNIKVSELAKHHELMVDAIRRNYSKRLEAAEKALANQCAVAVQACEDLTLARAKIAKLESEIEGDNGLRASKEAGWALAKSRLQLLEKLRTELESLKDKDNDRCQGCNILRSERYQKGSCPGGCFGDGVKYLGAELQKERDRRVEHRQMNQSLNEQVQGLQAELEKKDRAWLREVEAHKASADRWLKWAKSMRTEIDQLKAANAELQRKNDNQAAAHDLPRVQDVAEIHELKQSLSTARGLLCEWVNFDFDCPHEEYDEENDCYDEDGTALCKLHEDTSSFLWCAKAKAVVHERDVDSDTEALRFRALFEEQKLERQYAESRLSTAIELLQWAQRFLLPSSINSISRAAFQTDLDAFLSTSPSPTERESVERKVLNACADLRISKMGLDGTPYIENDGKLHTLCLAVLALRGVKI